MPAAKTSTRSRSKAPAKGRSAKPRPRSRSKSKQPQSEQRHLDLAGLAFVAVAVFLGFVLYRDRDGGEAGRKLVDGLTWLVGDIAFGVPIALAALDSGRLGVSAVAVGLAVLLCVDLLASWRRNRPVRMSEAAGWTLVAVILAVGFGALLAATSGGPS